MNKKYLSLFLCLILSGCGNYGGLYLPEEKVEKENKLKEKKEANERIKEKYIYDTKKIEKVKGDKDSKKGRRETNAPSADDTKP